MVTLHFVFVCTFLFSFALSHVVTPNFAEDRPSTFSPFPVANDPSANPSTTASVTIYNNTVISSKKGLEQLKALYDEGSFRSFNMEITQDNLNLMNQDPTQEQKVHCRFTVDYNTPQAKTFSSFGVGCAIKGSVGSLRVCVDEYHRWNGNCRHLSYRVEANAFNVAKGFNGKGGNKSHSSANPQDFYGAHSVSFGGMPVDYAMMSERTSFQLMADVGIIAPMAVHAKLFLNGKYQGVFSFVQEVDSAFTRMHWKKDKNNGKGSIYKELWFNPLHMQDLSKPGTRPQKHDGWMQSVMNAITACALTQSAATNLFNTYFDVKSLVDATALNTLIGDTDDWRLRHNFFWYVREDDTGTKLVYIPWDYDRLDDTGSSTRSLGGKEWWDISGTTANNICNMAVLTPSQIANQMGGTPAMIAYNRDMYNQFPPDLSIPVTCDKITQLMAIALGPQIRQATLTLAPKVAASKIQGYWNTWNPQIQTAVSLDPAGPSISQMLSAQQTLLNYFLAGTAKAIQQVHDYTLNPTVVPAAADISISGWVIPRNNFASSPLPPPIASSLPPATAMFAPAPSPFTTTSFPPFSTTFGLPSPKAYAATTTFPSFATGGTFPSFGATTSFGASTSLAALPAAAPAFSFGTSSFAPVSAASFATSGF